MTTPTTQKQPYRVPEVDVDATVSLDQFSTDDIRAYLAQIDGVKRADQAAQVEYQDPNDVPRPQGLRIRDAGLDCITFLSMCGHREAARELALALSAKKSGVRCEHG